MPCHWVPAAIAALLAFVPRAAAEQPLDAHGDPLPEGVSVRLGSPRLRHALANRVAWAPDGQTILTWRQADDGAGDGNDRTIRFWDAATGKLLHTRLLPCRLTWTKEDAYLSADGNLFARCTREGLEIWNLAANRRLRTLPWAEVGYARQVVFSRDGKSMANVDSDARGYRILVWDLATGSKRLVGVHRELIEDLVFTADGRRVIATSPEERILRCWNATPDTSARLPHELWRTRARHSRLRLNGDGQVLVSWPFFGSGEEPVGLWDAATGQPLDVPARPTSSFGSISVSADGATFLLEGKALEVWDVHAGRCRAKHEGACQTAALAPDGKSFVTLDGGVLQRWDVASGRPLWPDGRPWSHLGPVSALAWSPDSQTLASSCRYGNDNAYLWDAATGKRLHTWNAIAGEAIAFLPDGKSLMMSRPASGCMQPWPVWKGESGKPLQFGAAPQSGPSRQTLLGVSVSPDGKKAVALHAVLGQDTLLASTFNVESGQRLFCWRTDKLAAYWGSERQFAERLSADARLFAGEQGVFEAATGRKLVTLELPDGKSCYPAVFAPDGALLAAGYGGYGPRKIGNVTVWERATGRVFRRLLTDAHGQSAFLPGGRGLVTAGPDGLHGWDLRDGTERFSRLAHNPGVTAENESFATVLAISPDGQKLATGHPDTTIHIWDLPAPPRPDPRPLADDQRATLWADLLHPDPAHALPALWRLEDDAAHTVPWLRERLRPVTILTAADLQTELADLDADQFARRERASKQLADRGEAARIALLEAVGSAASLEKQRRLRALLSGLAVTDPPRGDDLRGLRAILLLEHAGTLEARNLLKVLAAGAESARLTAEARAALARIR